MSNDVMALNAKIKNKVDEVKALCSGDHIEEAKVAKAELDEMQAKLEIMMDMENVAVPEEEVHPVHNEVDPIHAFAEAARNKFKNDIAYPNEGTNSQGGYTVPQDIQTKINKYKEDKFALESLVKTIGVSAPTGSRVFQTRAQHTGFSSVAEAAKIGQVAAPSFTVLEYSVTKYGGYLPVTNELLADSDANIAQVLIEWLGEEDIATRNNIIITKLNTLDKTNLSNIDGIKQAVNVTLGQRFAGNVRIVTNDDGFNYLDTLKNGQSEYLLKPSMDPTKPLERRLAVGSSIIPITVVPNAVLASGTQGGKAVMPFIIGDLKEALCIFDRKKLSITSSNTASVTNFNAFEQDMTLFRGIERLDSQFIDTDAVVYGTIKEA